MSDNPHEEFFDQELRNAFHSFQLPPTEHPEVWTGIEGRIAGLPAAAPALSRKLLLLPLATAVVGVAVGWLLPHPAAQPAPAAAPIEVPLPRSPSSPAALPTAALLPTATPVVAVAATTGAAPATRRRTQAAPPAANAAATEVSLVAELGGWPVAEPDLTAAVPSAEQLAAAPESAPAASILVPPQTEPAASTAQATHAPKPAGTNERIVYHKPRSRQPEPGTGFRRWFSHLGRSFRHLIGL